MSKVDQVAAAVQTITAEPAEVKMLLDEVNQGSREQAVGIQQIGNAISQMEGVRQNVTANAEELNTQSEIMKEVVSRLTAMVGKVERAKLEF